jgi:hypothetical protein
MRFVELPPDLRPNSEAGGNTRSDAGNSLERELIGSVIERWRSASMSQRAGDEFAADFSGPEAPPLQPAAQPMSAPAPVAAARAPQAPPQAPRAPQTYQTPQSVPPSPRGEALRSSLLRKPLDATVGAGAPGPAAPPAPTPMNASGGAQQNLSPPGYPPRYK